MNATAKVLLEAAAKLEEDAAKLKGAAAVLTYGEPEPEPYDGTRAEQLADYIEKHGGAVPRLEIVKKSGIPPGTIASLLGHKKKFCQDDHGYWHVKPPPEQKQA